MPTPTFSINKRAGESTKDAARRAFRNSNAAALAGAALALDAMPFPAICVLLEDHVTGRRDATATETRKLAQALDRFADEIERRREERDRAEDDDRPAHPDRAAFGRGAL